MMLPVQWWRRRFDVVSALPGARLIQASWFATGVFTLVSVAAAIDIGQLQIVAVVVDLALFAIGVVVFFLALVAGADRSRTHEMGIGGWFFLAGSAPRVVQRYLLGSFAVQVVVAFTVASVRVFTGLAFGILVPTIGLALCGLWGARHGTFGPRVVDVPVPETRRVGGVGKNAPHG